MEKIRVRGKAQNRTALGIVNAYLVLHPDATLQELQGVFSQEALGEDVLKDINEVKGDENFAMTWFNEPDEIINLSNGQQVVLKQIWTKEHFDKIRALAPKYGIKIASFKKTKAFVKGSYTLEELEDGILANYKGEKLAYADSINIKDDEDDDGECNCICCSRRWIWAVLMLLLLLILLLCCKTCCKNTCGVADAPQIEQVESEYDTTFDQGKRVEDEAALTRLSDYMPRIQYNEGSAELTEESKEPLNELAKYLDENKKYRLRVEGHSSSTGTDEINQELSEARAKNMVEYLASQGVARKRMSFVGKGDREPKYEPSSDARNQRTELILVE